MYGEDQFCSDARCWADNACKKTFQTLGGVEASGRDKFMETRGEFMKWWMGRLLTDSAFAWENFGGADSWSMDSLAYSFVKEGIRFVLLNEHPLATTVEVTNRLSGTLRSRTTSGYAGQSIQHLKDELARTSQPIVLVMHFPPHSEGNGCEPQHAWCSRDSEERVKTLLEGSTVVAIVSGHHHAWSGIWDWKPLGDTVQNAWGNNIKMIQAGSPVADFGRRWLKIDAEQCKMTFTIMEDRQPAKTCGRQNALPSFTGYDCNVEEGCRD